MHLRGRIRSQTRDGTPAIVRECVKRRARNQHLINGLVCVAGIESHRLFIRGDVLCAFRIEHRDLSVAARDNQLLDPHSKPLYVNRGTTASISGSELRMNGRRADPHLGGLYSRAANRFIQ